MLPAFFAAASSCGHSFLGLSINWWKFLPSQPTPPTCAIPDLSGPTDIWLVGLAVIDVLLYVAGFVAVVSIIIAGFEYVFSLGSADKITSARKRIQNSLIGLAIALIAVAVVTFIGSQLGGS